MRRLVLLIALPIAMSCEQPTAANVLQTRLDAARAAWTRQKITSYSFLLSTECFCSPDVAGPNRVTVTNGVVTGVVRAADGAVLDVRNGRTIDQLFDFIASTLDGPFGRLTVQYDIARGYPSSIDADPVKNATDDEVRYFSSALVVTPP
ncbi:MAG: hypothetical protein JWO05_1483 [Gemmatimonadetes bacterium]|nr:hypothetical protein [Gemmatimonadota bacterium]